MTRVDEDLVPLNEEIDHIRAYLEIQQLRYKDMFSYDLKVDRMVEDMLILSRVERSGAHLPDAAADLSTSRRTPPCGSNRWPSRQAIPCPTTSRRP